ncbi:aldo-keto reductase family 1 member E1 [Microdochium trichocladiopsis]|uniref:Aldo-keto reductase family 1 member E1 n=1 Tax=Microdochium trichocladiopsis TaxID=1682393 RepID=A0A9P8Y0C6_9PEZI|nr:aldo-keto reductase family 1 member E1 [Microdochium trichocladiopsis]KAH7027478.1 aldo-keto reductase family 1 member E1 [Microdochium trichocladiopsis]
MAHPNRSFSLATKVKLNSGYMIPQLQLGLYMMSGREVLSAVPHALDLGYRGFDSAQMYHNEREAGRAITSWLKNTTAWTRGDIFYTSKLASNSEDYDEVRRSITRSVEACGLGYIDLFLLHSPHGGPTARLESWRAVEDAIAAGEVRSGGVSNYGVKHIQELMSANPKILPSVNQIEVHPFNTQASIRKVCFDFNIVVEAYAPLARGMRMQHPVVVQLARKYGCTVAQLFVRWSLQHGLVALPKSTKAARMAENAEVNGFEISEADMATMDALDEHLVTDWDPTNVP